ncbi:hypothetical protein Tco_0537032 [Tanacetum coccineum]
MDHNTQILFCRIPLASGQLSAARPTVAQPAATYLIKFLGKQKVSDNDHYDFPLIYNVNGHTLHFGRSEIFLITGFKFELLSSHKSREGDISFHDRVFLEKIGEYVKNIDLLSVIEDEERFTRSAVDDVFLRMVDNIEAWNDFP